MVEFYRGDDSCGRNSTSKSITTFTGIACEHPAVSVVTRSAAETGEPLSIHRTSEAAEDLQVFGTLGFDPAQGYKAERRKKRMG